MKVDFEMIEMVNDRGVLAFTIHATLTSNGHLYILIASTLLRALWSEHAGYYGGDPITVSLRAPFPQGYDEIDPPSLWDILLMIEGGVRLVDAVESRFDEQMGAPSHFARLFDMAYQRRARN